MKRTAAGGFERGMGYRAEFVLGSPVMLLFGEPGARGLDCGLLTQVPLHESRA